MGQPSGASAVGQRPPRLVCPFAPGRLRWETSVALQTSGYPVDWVRLPASDPTAYGRLFRDLWSAGETFVICEQDVVPTQDQLDDIMGCGHPWCSYEYDNDLYPDGPMFGLVRFDRRVMSEWPLAAGVALVVGKRRDMEVAWWNVDSHVARDLMIRGVKWARHTPPVHHAHVGPPSGTDCVA